MQAKVKQLEAEEQERWTAEREQKLSFMQTQIMKKHALEKNAFQKKVESQLDVMKKKRALDTLQLLQKFENAKKEIAVQQALELKLSLKKGSQSSLSDSRYSPSRSSSSFKGNQ